MPEEAYAQTCKYQGQLQLLNDHPLDKASPGWMNSIKVMVMVSLPI